MWTRSVFQLLSNTWREHSWLTGACHHKTDTAALWQFFDKHLQDLWDLEIIQNRLSMVDFGLGCEICTKNWKAVEKQHKCFCTASDAEIYPCVILNTLWHNTWVLVGLLRSLTHGGLWSCISTSLWASCHPKHSGQHSRFSVFWSHRWAYSPNYCRQH